MVYLRECHAPERFVFRVELETRSAARPPEVSVVDTTENTGQLLKNIVHLYCFTLYSAAKYLFGVQENGNMLQTVEESKA